MFSRLYQSITQSASVILSPKAILSEFIAKALSVYFIVDPSLVESNLLSDTKITLRNVHLKPLPLNGERGESKQQKQVLYLIGTVTEIEFKWTWGSASDGSTSYVRDTQLSINGGQFRIIVQDEVSISMTDNSVDNSVFDDDANIPTSNSNTTTNETNETESALSTHVSQIIDHLSLHINNIEVVIDVDDTSLFVMELKEISLVSHGTQNQSDNDPMIDESISSGTQHLLQRLTIGQITGLIRSKVNNDNPLSCVELCGYMATIKRISGQRFTGGIWTGLDINGQTLLDGFNNMTCKSHDLLYVNGGTKQIQVLLKILNKLNDIVQANNSGNLSYNTSDSTSTDTTGSGGIHCSTNSSASDDNTTPISTFRLQIPGIHVTVPNGATVMLPPSWLQYDGTTVTVAGSDNILINETFHAIQLSQNTQWSLQVPLSMVSSGTSNEQEQNIRFQLSSNTSKKIVNETLVIVQYNNKEMNHLIQGFVDAFELVRYDKLSAMLLDEYEKSSTVLSSTETFDAVSGQTSNTTTTQKKKLLHIALNGNIVIKLQSEIGDRRRATTDWVDIVVRPLTTAVIVDNTGASVSALQGDGIDIFESSFGDTFAVSIPPFDMYPQEPFVTLSDTLIVTSESFQQVNHLREFVKSLVPNPIMSNNMTTEKPIDTFESNVGSKFSNTKQIKIPFTIKAPQIKLLISESNNVLSIQHISIVQNSSLRLNIERVDLESDTKSISITSIVASNDGLEIGQIDKCSIMGAGRLVEPIVGINCKFSGKGVEIIVPTIRLQMETDEGDNTSATNTNNSNTNSNASADIELPFDVSITIAKAEIVLSDKNTTELDSLHVSAKSVSNEEVDLTLGKHAVKAEISLQNIQHTELMKLTKLYGTGVIYSGRRRSIYESYVSVESVDVVSGFSTLDWKRMIGRGAQAKRVPFELPHVQVASLDVNVSYKGHIVSSESNIIPILAFVGNEYTTSEDLTNHIARSIVSSAPTFLTNATLSGLNIVDSIGSSAGRAVLGATIAGSVTGSVVGVVAVDAVKGAISQGKSSRGVATDSKYIFGDFTRGIIHTMNQAPEAGVSGTAESMSQYTTDNKSRLAGAGGSSIGMIVGTAVAGPIGLIAGSVLGNVLGSRAVSDDPNANNTDSNTHQQSSTYPGLVNTNTLVSSVQQQSHHQTTQEYQNQYQSQQQQQGHQQQQQQYQQQGQQQQQQQQQRPYRFGDLSRRIIAQGKQQDGRSEKDGYQFGDFSRGLFGK